MTPGVPARRRVGRDQRTRVSTVASSSVHKLCSRQPHSNDDEAQGNVRNRAPLFALARQRSTQCPADAC